MCIAAHRKFVFIFRVFFFFVATTWSDIHNAFLFFFSATPLPARERHSQNQFKVYCVFKTFVKKVLQKYVK